MAALLALATAADRGSEVRRWECPIAELLHVGIFTVAHLCTHARAISWTGFVVSAAITRLDLGLDPAIKGLRECGGS